MPYTPENNPYIPGDPYSYDLKWIVQKIKTVDEAIRSLDETIYAKVIAALEKLNPVVYGSVDKMIEADQSAGTLAYTLGYYQEADGGCSLYYVTDDYNDIIGIPFYVTISANKWAVPVILTEYVTPEMFGAKGDGSSDDSNAISAWLKYAPNHTLHFVKGKEYVFMDGILASDTVIEGNGAVLHPVIINSVLQNMFNCDNYDLVIKNATFKSIAQAYVTGSNARKPLITGKSNNFAFDNITFDTIQLSNVSDDGPDARTRIASCLTAYDSNVTFKNCNFIKCRNTEFVYVFTEDENVFLNDKTNTIVLNNVHFEGCSGSVNTLSKYLFIDGITGYHSYNGSLLNTFADVIYAHNIHCYNETNPNSSYLYALDATEDGLYQSSYVELRDISCESYMVPCNIKAENLVADNVSFIRMMHAYISNSTYSPITTRPDLTEYKCNCSNCAGIAVAGSPAAPLTTVLNYKFENCEFRNELVSGSFDSNNVSVTFVSCENIKTPIMYRGTSNFFGCTFANPNSGSSLVAGAHVRAVGCIYEGDTPAPPISFSNTDYVKACYNINETP